MNKLNYLIELHCFFLQNYLQLELLKNCIFISTYALICQRGVAFDHINKLVKFYFVGINESVKYKCNRKNKYKNTLNVAL